MRLLIVEDDAHLSQALSTELLARGFDVVSAADGADGLAHLTRGFFDVVILDAGLPGLNGLEVLRRVRSSADLTPIVILAEQDRACDEATALDRGADDFLTKPCSIDVLAARVRALVRRCGPKPGEALTAGSLELDPSRRIVRRDSTAIQLTRREYELLHYLMQRKSMAVTRAEILRNVWDAKCHGASNILDVYIRNLRCKIDIPFGVKSIETVHGVGYRLSCSY